jgi:glucokinase
VRVVCGAVRGYVRDVAPLYLAIDLAPTRLTAGIVDASGTVVLRDRISASGRQAVPGLVRLAQRVLAAGPGPVEACGVACSGEVDRAEGVVRSRHDPVWSGVKLTELLSSAIDAPVAIDTRGRASVLAEHWCGAAVGHRNVMSIVADEFVDAGIISDGRLLHGRSSQAGQIAHLIVEPDGLRCRCGGDGCLDAYVGAVAVQADTGRELFRTPLAIVERSGIMLGRAIASLGATLDLGLILLSGMLPATFGAPMLGALERELEARLRLVHLSEVKVRMLGSEGVSTLVGAAALARPVVRTGG